MTVIVRAAAIAAFCLLAIGGCGGGGGGGGDTSPPPVPDNPSLKANPQRVDVTADAAVSAHPTAAVVLTVVNPPSSGVYVSGTYSTSGVDTVGLTVNGTTQATLTVYFKDPSVLGAGTYQDTLSIGICTDSTCAQLRNGTQITIPITYTVTITAGVSLVANPATTGAGMSTTLTWSSTNASSCAAAGEWSGARAAAGSEVVTVGGIGSHTYTLTCSGPGSPGQASVVVNAAGPSVAFSVFPSAVSTGKTVTLRWASQYSDSCVASGDWSGTLSTAGYRTLVAASPGSLNFHIVCANSAAAAPADATVSVTPAPVAPPATAYRMNESHDGVIVLQNGSGHPAGSAPAWTVDLGAPVSYPLIAGGRVFVTTSNPDGSYGNRLYALDASTGAVVWGPIAVPGVYFGSGLAYEAGRVFVLMFDGGLRAYSAATGAALWTAQLRGYWYEAPPNAYGGMVFVAGNGGISAVDAASGAIRWQSWDGATTGWESPAVTSEGVYLQSGYSCDATALEPLTGALLWSSRSACDTPWGYTPVARNGVLYGRAGGSLNLFDASTGQFQVQLGSQSAPSITATTMIALNAGTLSAIRLSDRVQTWTFAGDGGLLANPVVVNSTVFIGSASGNVYGLDVDTGAPVWTGLSPFPIIGHQENGGPGPMSGPAAGEDLLVFVGTNALVAWKLQ